MLAYALLRECVALANACAGAELVTCRLRTVSGQPVASGDGVTIEAEQVVWDGAQGFDLVLLCGGSDPQPPLPMGLRGFLRAADAAGATLAGVGGGALILARLGFLDGHEAAIEPDVLLSAGTMGLDLSPSPAPFVLDRRRLTATGGIASADALLHWIARTHGSDLAFRTGEALAQGRIGHSAEILRLPQPADPIMAQMQAVMAAHLADPLPLSRVAGELGLSPKQMRSRCQRSLGRLPAQVYLALRLRRADMLIRDTGQSVAEVARAAGFASPSAFTRRYREYFGAPPRVVRKAG